MLVKITIKNFISPKNYKIIYSGVEIPRKNLSYFKNKNRRIKICTVSNINPDKNLTFFIDVAKFILEKNKNFEFIIYGKFWPNQRKYYNKILNEISNCKRIKIIENETNANKIYKNIDLYFCSSRYESSPLSVWEAMSYKNIVVSTPVGDVPKIIINNQNGYILDNWNVKKTSLKILKISKKLKNLDRVRNQAYNSINKKFNIIKKKEEIIKYINN